MKVQEKINFAISEKGAAYLILIDPDEINGEKLISFVRHCEQSGVDGFLVGGSLMMTNVLDEVLETISSVSKLPTILFPGSVSQVSSKADAILFISLVSGRNAEHLIGTHVIAAPLIKKSGLESISTGYMLIESGKKTTAEYMSGSSPIPRNKPEIATATALAAEYLVKNHEMLNEKVYRMPEEIDKEIARLKLKSMGVRIDILTPLQKKYLSSWELGT